MIYSVKDIQHVDFDATLLIWNAKMTSESNEAAIINLSIKKGSLT